MFNCGTLVKTKTYSIQKQTQKYNYWYLSSQTSTKVFIKEESSLKSHSEILQCSFVPRLFEKHLPVCFDSWTRQQLQERFTNDHPRPMKACLYNQIHWLKTVRENWCFTSYLQTQPQRLGQIKYNNINKRPAKWKRAAPCAARSVFSEMSHVKKDVLFHEWLPLRGPSSLVFLYFA